MAVYDDLVAAAYRPSCPYCRPLRRCNRHADMGEKMLNGCSDCGCAYHGERRCECHCAAPSLTLTIPVHA